MNNEVTTVINEDLCIGCGMCVKVCVCDTLEIVNGKSKVIGEKSINCGHCMAACPKGAITVKGIDDNTIKFKTFDK